MFTQKIDLDAITLQDLFGVTDANLRALERELGVTAATHEGCAELRGETEEAVALAAETLRTLDKMRRLGERSEERRVGKEC